jgi:Fur family transcriptional regulator, ferric uptake regulator
MTDETAKEIEQQFVQYTHSIGLKNHNPRLIVLRGFLQLGKPVSAMDVLYAVKQVDMNVSYGTVLKTMSLLIDCGLARKQMDVRPGMAHNRVLYVPADVIITCKHEHVLCKDCGAVLAAAKA